MHALVGGDMEDEHLVKEGEGHDQKQGAEQDVEQPLLILAKPSELVNDIIEITVRHGADAWLATDGDGAKSLLFLRSSLDY